MPLCVPGLKAKTKTPDRIVLPTRGAVLCRVAKACSSRDMLTPQACMASSAPSRPCPTLPLLEKTFTLSANPRPAPSQPQDAAGNSANVFYYNIAVEEVDVLDSMQLKEESLKKQIWERDLLR